MTWTKNFTGIKLKKSELFKKLRNNEERIILQHKWPAKPNETRDRLILYDDSDRSHRIAKNHKYKYQLILLPHSCIDDCRDDCLTGTKKSTAESQVTSTTDPSQALDQSISGNSVTSQGSTSIGKNRSSFESSDQPPNLRKSTAQLETGSKKPIKSLGMRMLSNYKIQVDAIKNPKVTTNRGWIYNSKSEVDRELNAFELYTFSTFGVVYGEKIDLKKLDLLLTGECKLQIGS